MCGIAGVMFLTEGRQEEATAAATRMMCALRHRGPDGEGVWCSEAGVPVTAAFGHTRLAIIDLSDAARQPMRAGQAAITFNGEIFNFRALRAKLESGGTAFGSVSDTEVVLRGWERWGTAGCLERLDGMFAFGLWDGGRRRLTLARDRLGVKPLYYARLEHGLVFASEVRAILASGLVQPRLDDAALWHYLACQTAPSPETLVAGIRMLGPGETLEFDAAGGIALRRYWDFLDSDDGTAGSHNAAAARQALAERLDAAVRSHLVSDVPVGVFLSGGIDSSALVSIMRSAGLTARTFSLRFDEAALDESRHARAVAEAFETDHVELPLTEARVLDLLPEMLRAVDHPSGDGVNTYVVSRLARHAGVKVALSGLGGDELFAGYPSFERLRRLAPIAAAWSRTPAVVRKAAAGAVRGVSGRSVAAGKAVAVAEGDGTLASLWPVTRQLFDDDTRRALIAPERRPDEGGRGPYEALLAEAFARHPDASLWARVSFAEARAYMHDVLLRDTDQMSMAHGLEVRVPLLDHRLVRYVVSLPDAVKRAGAGPKALLVQSLARPLPRTVVERPKQGFTLPFDAWMRGALRSLCADRLGDRGLAGRGLFVPGAVDRLWRRFLERDPAVTWSRIWVLVALDAWLERTGVEGSHG